MISLGLMCARGKSRCLSLLTNVLQDLLVASLFRNFLLAERIMRAASCTPVSYPRLPPTHQHPMWQVSPQHRQHCSTV